MAMNKKQFAMLLTAQEMGKKIAGIVEAAKIKPETAAKAITDIGEIVTKFNADFGDVDPRWHNPAGTPAAPDDVRTRAAAMGSFVQK